MDEPGGGTRRSDDAPVGQQLAYIHSCGSEHDVEERVGIRNGFLFIILLLVRN